MPDRDKQDSIQPELSKPAGNVTTNLEHVFRAECSGQPAIILNDGEHSAYRWLTREAAAELAGSRTNREAILEQVPGANA